jgi:hypothetical protein
MNEITRKQFDEYCKDLEWGLKRCDISFYRQKEEKFRFIKEPRWGCIIERFLDNEITLAQYKYYMFVINEDFENIITKGKDIDCLDIEFYACKFLNALGFVIVYDTMDEETFPAPRWSRKDRTYHYNKFIEDFIIKNNYSIYMGLIID